MPSLKDLSKGEERLTSGHKLCPGCAESIIVRAVTKATNNPIVVSCATSCLEVSSTEFPQTAWKVPYIHNAFENAAATLSGVESAYLALKRRGKVNKEIKFLAFGGDGGTYDIGLQSLSGTLERGHDVVYVCLDNEAYMNTGIQRSSATPHGAWTNTSQVGDAHRGKEEFKKDILQVVAAHDIPYAAQASPHNYMDLFNKAKKAFETKGPAYINVISPCVPGWKYPAHLTIKMAKLAVETCFWPLVEIERGKWKLNFDPGDNKKPITEWIKHQKRFKHIFKPENKHILDELQAHVDLKWDLYKKRCQL
jgi:pyruvate ferredoxin oxidoreductase beta subunit